MCSSENITLFSILRVFDCENLQFPFKRIYNSSTFEQYVYSNVILLILQDFGENKELDNIIANSLQQLENARAFYAQIQEKARTKPN